MEMKSMNRDHFYLCELTAKQFLKKSDIILYSYNCQLSSEMPDVLCYKNGYTTLFEIKVSLSDFKADQKKECRTKYKVKYFPYFQRHNNEIKKLFWKNPDMEEFIKEYPHLGSRRYYVCPYGMIDPEATEKWGLYWVKNNRLYLKKESKQFKRNIHLEIKILTHAFRRYASLNAENIFINTY